MTTESAQPSAWSFLRCPQCQSALQLPAPEARAEAKWLSCERCGKHYPLLVGIPVLTARPDEWLERWRAGLGWFSQTMAIAQNQMMAEFMDEELSERSQNRVRQLAGALARHREQVLSLMAKAGIAAAVVESEKGDSSAYSPEAYFSHVLRDYGWPPEVDEVGTSWKHLLNALPDDFQPGSTLVLGAGTGRLAWQIASELAKGAPVLAIDINPFPLLVTALLLAGQEVALTELAAHPRKSAQPAVSRSLTCPLEPAKNLSLLLADALDPPIARGKWDTVVTPWFVDEVQQDAAVIPDLVRSLLREGGSFICTGPFLYESGHTKPSLRYCADEFVEFVERAGFEVTAAKYGQQSHMASPISTRGRLEHVLYLHARKDSSRRVERPVLPPFLKPAGAASPIPRPKGLEAAEFSPQEVNEVAALIDGERSVRQITRILLERGVLVKDPTAESGVRGCLKMIFQQLGAL